MVVALIVYFDNSVDLGGILLLGFEYFVVGVGLDLRSCFRLWV